MANEINRIGINTASVNPNGYQPNGNQPTPDEEPPVATPQAPTPQAVAPDDVFAYMAGSAVVHRPQVYDVSKYVSPESAARIGAMMGNFEAAVAQGLLAIEQEGLLLSDDAKYALAAEMVS